jgi:hypothetical protein
MLFPLGVVAVTSGRICVPFLSTYGTLVLVFGGRGRVMEEKVQGAPILLAGGSRSPSPPLQRTMTVTTLMWWTVMRKTLPVLLLHLVHPVVE